MRLATTVGNSLSIIGSSIVIFLYFMFCRPSVANNTLSTRLIIWNSFYDLVFAAAQIWQINLTSSAAPWQCQAAMGIWISFGIGTSMFTGIIALSLHITFFCHRSSKSLSMAIKRVDRFEKPLVITPIILSLILGGLPYIRMAYGFNESGQNCWFKGAGTVENITWQFSVFFGPLAVILIYCTIIFILVVIQIQRLVSKLPFGTNKKAINSSRRLLLFPLIFVAISACNFAVEIDNFVTGQTNIVLLYLNVVSLSLQGFFNSLVFLVWNGTLRGSLGYICRAISTCKFESLHDPDSIYSPEKSTAMANPLKSRAQV